MEEDDSVFQKREEQRTNKHGAITDAATGWDRNSLTRDFAFLVTGQDALDATGLESLAVASLS